MRVSRVLGLLLTVQIMNASGQARGPALQLSTALDRRLSCPANAALGKAVRLRLPAVRFSTDGPLRPGDLLVSLQRVGGASWRFEVKRSDGSVVMSRELMPMPCPQLADTCALILERYLSSIEWSGRKVGVAPLPPVEPTPESQRSAARPLAPQPGTARGEQPVPTADAAPERVAHPWPGKEVETAQGRPAQSASAESGEPGPGKAAEHAAERPAAATPKKAPPQASNVAAAIADARLSRGRSPLDEGPASALTVWVGGGAWLGAPLEASPALSFQLGLRLFRRFHASLLILATTPAQRAVSWAGELRGALHLQSFAGLATFSVCNGGGAFSACGGLLGGVRLTSARTSGPSTGARLFSTTGALVPLPQLGLHGKFSWPLYGRFWVGLDLTLAAPLGRATFDVQGIEDARYATPWVDFSGMLNAGFRLF